MVNDYLKKLLSIEIPKEPEQGKGVIPVNTILCLSLETIQFLYTIAKDNMAYLGESILSFTKYITRIKDFLNINSGDRLSNPNRNFFREVLVGFKDLSISNTNSPKKAKHKTKEIYYIVFCDYKLQYKNDLNNSESNWKDILCELLMMIKLRPYYEMISASSETSILPLNDLLERIREYPELFHIVNTIEIELLITSLMSYSKQATTHNIILELIDFYKKKITCIKSEKQKLKKIKNNITITTRYYCNKIKAERIEYEEEIIPSLLAEILIDSKNTFQFTIEEITMGKDDSSNNRKEQMKVYRLSYITKKVTEEVKAIKKKTLLKCNTIQELLNYCIKTPVILELLSNESLERQGICNDFINALYLPLDRLITTIKIKKEEAVRINRYIKKYALTKLYPQ